MLASYALLAASILLVLTGWVSSSFDSTAKDVEVEIRLYYDGNVDDDTWSHGRIKRQLAAGNGLPDQANTKDTRKSSTDTKRKQMDVTLTVDGNKQTITLDSVKTFKFNADKYTVSNQSVVKEDASQKIPKEYELFIDQQHPSTAMLMACDADGNNCNSMGSFLNGTETLIIQSYNSTPFSSKAKHLQHRITSSADSRIMGIAADGSQLKVPVNFRRKRDMNLTSRMRKNLQRKRRQAVTSHVVELIILVDYSEYIHWLNRSTDADAAKDAMELYFILMTNMMDERFKTVYEQTGTIDVSFMINGFIFVENETDNPWEVNNEISPGAVNVNNMLDDLTVWTMTNQGYLPAHDHIMAISNLNLAVVKEDSVKTSILGVAWSASMCNTGYSVSIIEDAGLGLVDYVATHEIGHSLSSTHDVSAGCADADFFVMGTNGGSPNDGLYGTGKESNPWTFSKCAVSAISSFVQSLGSGSCLLSSTFIQADYDNYKTFLAPGIIIPIDSQCELVYGKGSRRCFALDASICSDGAYCWNPADPNYCYTLFVRQGTICGEQKRCDRGVCTNSTIVMPNCGPESSFVPPGPEFISDVQTTVTPPTAAATTRFVESTNNVQLDC